MFESSITKYLFGFSIIVILSYAGMHMKQSFGSNDEYELIKKFR